MARSERCQNGLGRQKETDNSKNMEEKKTTKEGTDRNHGDEFFFSFSFFLFHTEMR